MWKMMCGLVAVVFVTVAMAAEQPATDENHWLPSVQNSRPSRSIHTRDWVAQAWHPDTDSLPPSSHQRWSADDEDREAVAWEPQEALGAAFRTNSHGNLDDDIEKAEEAILELVRQQESPWVAKRQPPRRLGSLVDLYKDVAHGLSPFVATPENQILPANPENQILPVNPENQILPAKPERRSGRRPAACRFGPFGLVCWNAARRGAVMRQRSAQYTQ